MPVISNSEPDIITAGETVQWTRSFPDYPASNWTLKYSFQAPGKDLISIVASSSGNDFAASISATSTANYSPGLYVWTAFVEAGSERHTAARGTITILASPLTALGATHAVRMLGLIEAALEGRIPNGLESTDIDGQRIDRIPVVDLQRLRDKYRTEAQAEQFKASAAAGNRKRRTIGMRFVRS